MTCVVERGNGLDRSALGHKKKKKLPRKRERERMGGLGSHDKEGEEELGYEWGCGLGL